jgi:hypothetical protein
LLSKAPSSEAIRLDCEAPQLNNTNVTLAHEGGVPPPMATIAADRLQWWLRYRTPMA